MFKFNYIVHKERKYSIITCNKKKGLIRDDNEVILAPIYYDIIIRGANVYIENENEIEDELIMDSINEGICCIKRFYQNTQSGFHNFFFVNGHGDTIIGIDDAWIRKNRILGNIDYGYGFIDGQARLRSGDDAIYINRLGEITKHICDFYAEPYKYIDGREHLNYDGQYDGWCIYPNLWENLD